MKTLTLIRHAKSTWQYDELTDFERPLNSRGRRDAPRMAIRVFDALGLPDRWISSPASRAITTARLFASALRLPDPPIDIRTEIYDASADRLMALIGDLDDALSHVWLFGHNPGLSELAERLSPQNAPEHLPTCAVASLHLEIASWSAVAAGSAQLAAYLYPKQEPA